MVPRVASDACNCRRYGRLERMPPRFCTLELQEQDYKDSLCGRGGKRKAEERRNRSGKAKRGDARLGEGMENKVNGSYHANDETTKSNDARSTPTWHGMNPTLGTSFEIHFMLNY